MSNEKQAGSDAGKVVDAIDKKFALMAQLQQVKTQMREVDRELVKMAPGRVDVQAVLHCW